MTRENLVGATFSRLGTPHLVLCGVMASIPQSRAWIEAALGQTTITFLTADRATREQRLRGREVGSGFERDMRASDDVAAFLAEHDPPQMVTVTTEGKTVLEVTLEVLAASGWVSASSPPVR